MIQQTFEAVRHLIPRPTSNDDPVMLAARTEFATQILKWLHSNGGGGETIDEVLADIEKVGPYCGQNGFELAKEFESYAYYAPDAELVEILDGWDHCLDSAERVAVKKWIDECEVKPQLEPGTRVKVRYGHDVTEGVIQPPQKWNLDCGQYLVKRDTDGIVVKGSCTLGVNINYEDVLGVVE